jgi:phage gp29-like protein
MKSPMLLDAYGRPIQRQALTQEVAAATYGGVRSPITGYPGDGLTPTKLAAILREADAGNPLSYLELAETVEERDLHYLGVLGTRRRAVSQIEVTVEAGSDAPEHEAHAQMVRDWLKRDELQEELFDILDAVGKGYSLTEVIYDHTEGQYMPRLERRDPRWFRFDRHDHTTPLLLGEGGQEEPLAPGKFIYARMQAKSGLPIRSGIARAGLWAYLFKMYTQRDWAIFSQTYGQPVRVGKFASGATDEDKRTLFRAVANIAGDMAAIIPDSMMIEFIESGNVGAGHSMYKERVEFLDMQISKAVLGQTATTDAVTGGLGSGKEHGDVRSDIKSADAKTLAAVLNRDLIRIWVQLEFGPQKVYPRLRIEDPEEENLKALADAIGPLIDRGLEVDMSDMRERFGLPEPKTGAKILRPQGAGASLPDQPPPNWEIKRNPDVFKRVEAVPAPTTALQAEDPVAGKKLGVSAEDVLTDRMMLEAAGPFDALLVKIEAMMAAASTLDELRAMLLEGFPGLDATELAGVLAMGLLAANTGGRVAVETESE